MTESFAYIGDELDVFKLAVNWKRYWASRIARYLGRRVLEVGAGIGGTTRLLAQAPRDLWLGLEPDATMLADLLAQQASGQYPAWCSFRAGTIAALAADELFDSIIYIDVLEHIEADGPELEAAAQHLAPGGHLVVLSPAYPYLFTAFDAAIGHYRRYTKKSLVALAPPGLMLVEAFYLDSVGLMTSLANKLVLHSPRPTAGQITFWDSYIIPISRLVDRLHGCAAGRSIIAVWRRD